MNKYTNTTDAYETWCTVFCCTYSHMAHTYALYMHIDCLGAMNAWVRDTPNYLHSRSHMLVWCFETVQNSLDHNTNCLSFCCTCIAIKNEFIPTETNECSPYYENSYSQTLPTCNVVIMEPNCKATIIVDKETGNIVVFLTHSLSVVQIERSCIRIVLTTILTTTTFENWLIATRAVFAAINTVYFLK